jgi:signal transduction histidine kinase
MPDRNPNQKLDIFVIDDNPDHLELISKRLKDGFKNSPASIRIRTYSLPEVALAEVLALDSLCVILIDHHLGTSTGIEWLNDFVHANAGPVFMITNSGNERIAAQAFRIGAADYFDKFSILRDPKPLIKSIRHALRKEVLEHTNRELSVQLRQLNDSLNEKNLRLQELTDTAHRFVEDVAHEFRTPLTVIREFTSIILDGLGGETTQKQQEYLKHILNSSSDLALLVDDFLNSSRLRCGNIRVNRAPHRVPELIAGISSALESRTKSKNITLEFDISESLPEFYGDLDKARRSLQNLIINAIKYSESGTTVRISANVDEESCVRVSVLDQGPGICPELQQKLSTRFNRGDCAESGNESGFGLGLNIVCDLVRINFGKLTLTSELGVGSEFSFSLPQNELDHIIRCMVINSCASSDAQVYVHKVSRTGQSDFGSDLKSIMRPTDLVMRNPEDQSWMIFAVCEDPKKFKQRLIAADKQIRGENQRADDPPLSITLIGESSIDSVLEHGIETLFPTTSNEVTHA